MGWFGLHSPKDLAEWAANLVQLGTGHAGQAKAERQDQDRRDREDEAARQWDPARAGANAGFDALKAEHGGGFDPAVLVGDKREPFPAWAHQKIWNALNDAASPVAAAKINDAAQGWRDLGYKTKQFADEFSNGVAQDVEQMMQGRSAGAFIDATRTFCSDVGKLSVAQQLVARGMALHGDYLGQAKDSVPQPEKSGGFTDMVIDHLPFQGYFKGSQYRAEEAEKDAQRVMTDVYQANVVRDVDPTRPVLPTPSNPVNGPGVPDPGTSFGGQQQDGRGGGTTPAGTGGQPPGAAGTGSGSGDGSGLGAEGAKENSPGSDTNQDPASTNPSSTTTPAGMASSAPSAGNTRQGVPGLGSPTGQPSTVGSGGLSGVGGLPGFGAGGGSGSGTGGRAGTPGRSVPGAKISGEPTAARAAARLGQPGAPGSPGGVPPGARGKAMRSAKSRRRTIWSTTAARNYWVSCRPRCRRAG